MPRLPMTEGKVKAKSTMSTQIKGVKQEAQILIVPRLYTFIEFLIKITKFLCESRNLIR